MDLTCAELHFTDICDQNCCAETYLCSFNVRESICFVDDGWEVMSQASVKRRQLKLYAIFISDSHIYSYDNIFNSNTNRMH